MIPISPLEQKLGIEIKNKDLLTQALTHASYANEHNSPDNERLEFLGDAVIGLLMGDYLYHKGIPSEGEMSKKRAQLVCEEALNHYARKINLSKELHLGKGGELSNGRLNPSIVADAFEAIFGAVFLDQGFHEAKALFYRIVTPYLDEVVIKDYKSTLQELVQTDRRNISYHLEAQSGPSHDRVFTVSVRMDDITLGIGVGRTKKEAEQNAAREALNILAKE
ncbi:ribonuclease III [Acholeplasma vituli]|uniref:Ribonuclease 3 n=1 Tax=Paracholeplasma vituli TaxID=69473 RepID=A0ABT2PUE9_9MOLU|nr:ribonuclease III [Paracholeplasma vituli]MCU0104373.1 ribonuclease III [Paracholeplasma vituli]